MPRGGKRTGAGRPAKPLFKRLDEGIGAVRHEKPQVLAFSQEIKNNQSGGENAQNNQSEQEFPKFLRELDIAAEKFLPSAEEIYDITLEWVRGTGCEKFVSAQLIEDFALTRRNYLECEYKCKAEGRVNDKGQMSPYVKASIEYMKQNMAIYREIWAIIAQNSTEDYKSNKGKSFLNLIKDRGF
ncbi:MAG: hypothetical protein FWE27_07970 [Defluviitaleaceae bacterium]|nr:hypothetical protein [Defluviitaleaceae bacterium]